MGYHAERSPSSAHRWTSCTASIDAQAGIVDEGSAAARHGTCGHQLSAECLEHGHDPQSYLGRKMLFWIHRESESNGEDWEDNFTDEFGELGRDWDQVDFVHEVVVDQDLIDACSAYINFVNDQIDQSDATPYIEKRVPIGHLTGEAKDGSLLEGKPEGTEEATGTSDVILVTSDTMHTIDAKFGRMKVMAYDVLEPAREDIITGEMAPEKLRMNLQLAMYLLGAYRKYGHPGIRYVSATIVQPFLNHVSSYSCTIEELLALGEWIKAKVIEGRKSPVFIANFDNCHFCKAKTTCSARQNAVLETALDGFDDIDEAKPRVIRVQELGSLYAKIDMILDWCKDVGVKVYEELQAGRPVVRNDGLRYKLVDGKKGAREWADLSAAEKAMKSMRLREDQMYTKHLISPAAAEKLAKVKKAKKGEVSPPPVIGSTQWNRLQALIHQANGSPAVALETDPREAIAPAVAGFDDVEEVPVASNDCADLF